jgi:hypothetical protein
VSVGNSWRWTSLGDIKFARASSLRRGSRGLTSSFVADHIGEAHSSLTRNPGNDSKALEFLKNMKKMVVDSGTIIANRL